jgi:hypothetical protein
LPFLCSEGRLQLLCYVSDPDFISQRAEPSHNQFVGIDFRRLSSLTIYD